MSKSISIFTCQNCGAQSNKWQGKCFDCGAWNSFVEENVEATSINKAKKKQSGDSKAKLLDEYLNENLDGSKRFSCGFKEVDRVLGGGFVEGSLLLFGGSPGIGKSTLLLQIISQVAKNKKAVYISGEESGHQVANRAERLGIKNLEKLYFQSTTNLDEALSSVQTAQAEFVVVDSVQTLFSPELQSSAGTVSQVRQVTQAFMDFAKQKNVTVALVGHVTKEGNIAGPKLLEHMVDGVFFFDLAASGSYRLLKSHKNRFGPTNELAVLEMQSTGMKEVSNPSQRFLEERNVDCPGSAVVAQLEGSQTFLTEIQSLTQSCHQGFPRRTMQGVDQNRVSVLLAVLEKTLGLNFTQEDVYCKVASGAKITEAGSDLAIAMSLVSALLNKKLPADVLFLGEIGLGGELRSVSALGARLSEAKTVGIKKAYVPKWNAEELSKDQSIEVIPVSTISQVYSNLF